ncbi:hypothetical protein KC19_VG290800 [Ceratodon purpureus]|uniref:DUF8039 domain-containing protein n=1 Tax=Ceratodon purpureus TaxID=3225 RepID=A0A8T0HUQ4_CERPU|nr:hypothetical protein KC19_VG290800 [Ceratodon purpureus]
MTVAGKKTRSGETTSERRLKKELRIGDSVWIVDTSNKYSRVAIGSVMALGGIGAFHNRPIPQEYVCENLHNIAVNAPLMIPVEEADQYSLSDALESSVLWSKALTFIET